MILSNNLIGKMPIPDDAVIRINLAWMKDIKEAKKIIDDSKHDIYLDFPSGRTKPPIPRITLDEATKLADSSDKVKYFAISNADDLELINYLINNVDAEIVPKIENLLGVLRLPSMKELGINTVMLDADDLFASLDRNSEEWEAARNNVRNSGLKVLELKGVCFE